METYAKTYLTFFGLDESDFIPCECCGAKATSFHHIEPRSKFGKRNKELQNAVENVMATCLDCHIKYGQIKHFKEQLKTIHSLKMQTRLKEVFGEN